MYNGGFNDRGGGGRFNDRALTPPVRQGEEIEVTVEAVGEKGDGIAKVQGFVLFVPGTRAGDRVKVRVTRVLAKVGFAEKIGDAQQQAASRPAPEPEEEFDPKTELDSEDFGDASDEGEEDSESAEDDEERKESADENDDSDDDDSDEDDSDEDDEKD